MDIAGKQRYSDTFFLVIMSVTQASLLWGPIWLPFITLAIGAMWLSTAKRKALPAIGFSVLLVFSLVNFGWEAGKELARADDARAGCIR